MASEREMYEILENGLVGEAASITASLGSNFERPKLHRESSRTSSIR